MQMTRASKDKSSNEKFLAEQGKRKIILFDVLTALDLKNKANKAYPSFAGGK